MMKKLLCFLMLLWPLFAMAQTRWSDQTARCFIDRYSNPQDIHWLYGKNSFSWQAGYVMFALEHLWEQTNRPDYFDYIRKFVDQHVDEEGNVASFTGKDPNTGMWCQVVDRAYAGIVKKAMMNADGFINLLDCSSIGIKHSYEEYITQPREISTFAAYGSFIIGTGIVEQLRSENE